MAKREISSTLRNLKFMQRAAHKEEITKNKEEPKPEESFFSPGVVRKCVVIMEGDPHPGAVIGRMSFQSFNPSVDKLNDAAASLRQQGVNNAYASSGNNENGEQSSRDNGLSQYEAECSNADKGKFQANGDLKRKQSELADRTQNQNISPKTVQDGEQSSPGCVRGSFKKSKSEKLDWSVLRPKHKNKQNQHQ